jgi:hypothetical protein
MRSLDAFLLGLAIALTLPAFGKIPDHWTYRDWMSCQAGRALPVMELSEILGEVGPKDTFVLKFMDNRQEMVVTFNDEYTIIPYSAYEHERTRKGKH